MARVATTPRAIARASSVARVDRARPRRRRRRATRSRARVSDVSDDDDDAVAAHALVERRSLLDSDDAEADARRRALANARAIAATADGGDVMRDVDADVLPLLLRLRSAGASAEGLRRGAAGVRAWRDALARGLLPDASLEWPEDETFRTALIEALGDLDMARFTRRFPPVLDTLMKNVLDILCVPLSCRLVHGASRLDQLQKADDHISDMNGLVVDILLIGGHHHSLGIRKNEVHIPAGFLTGLQQERREVGVFLTQQFPLCVEFFYIGKN